MNPHLLCVPVVLVLGGCAAPAPVATQTVAPAAPTEAPAAAGQMITRYELGDYQYPRAGEPKRAIFRSTRTAAMAGARNGGTRSEYSPASLAPLPPSAELRAELLAQREITSRIQRAQETISRLEKRVREQYATLLAQTEETVSLRQALEAERGRLQGLQVQLQEQLTASAASPPVAQAPVQAPAPEIKW